jgi:hypothetical protein
MEFFEGEGLQFWVFDGLGDWIDVFFVKDDGPYEFPVVERGLKLFPAYGCHWSLIFASIALT